MKDKNTLLSPCQPRLKTIVLWALKQILEVSIRMLHFLYTSPHLEDFTVSVSTCIPH